MNNIDFIIWVWGFPIITMVWTIVDYKMRTIAGKEKLTKKDGRWLYVEV
jgi:hypothetical protein